MKKIIVILPLAAVFLMPASTHATLVTTENATHTAIFGTGNPNTGWKDVTDTGNNIGLDLRIKQKAVPGLTPNNGSGDYTPSSAANIEFSVNVDPNGVGGITLASTGDTYWLSTDGGVPLELTVFGDNQYGTNGVTANGKGTKGTFAAEAGSFPEMQNSEPITFTASHLYDLFVENPAGKVIDSDVIGLNELVPVPEPSTYFAGALLLGICVAGPAHKRLFRQRQSATTA